MTFQGSLEFTIVERTLDKVVADLPIQDGVKNPFGVVHAGAILWFADVAATLLVLGTGQATEGMKGFPLAIALSANFLTNQSEGTFRATATFVKRGRTVSLVRTRVTGESDRLIADITTNHVLST